LPESKINRLIENVAVTWERTTPTRGTQMIFADMGVDPTPWGYSPYEENIEKLVAKDVPRDQIAAIGDAEIAITIAITSSGEKIGSVFRPMIMPRNTSTGTTALSRLIDREPEA
jgi:hypothetical protein